LTGYGYWGHFSGLHPNVLTVWGDDVYVTPFENGLKNMLARRALASCDALTGDSQDILAVAASLGADSECSFRVLWGVDFDVFKPGEEPAWRGRHGFKDEDIVYFSPRSYTQPYYNIDTVVAAAARVRAVEPRARFLFSGYEGDPAPFRAAAADAGISDVMAMVGRLPHDEFAVALRACDVFISVPSVDATAVSLLEAMSTGTGIIVSALPSALEWISAGQSGLVVAPRDVAALSEAMLQLGQDPALRRQCGRAAMTIAHQLVGFEQNMRVEAGSFGHLVNGGAWPIEVSLAHLSGPGGA